MDQTNWSFQFRNSSFITEALGTSEPDRRLDFATATELVRYLAVDDQDDAGPIQSKVNQRIDGDLIANAWRKARTRLKDLKHFPKYRKNTTNSTTRDSHLHVGDRNAQGRNPLSRTEIDKSHVVVPAGQIVFHGRANRENTGPPRLSRPHSIQS